MILNYINWNVDPEVFHIGGLSIRWYGILFAASFVFGYFIMLKIFRREGISQELLDKLSIYMGVATVVGARLGHCLFYQPDYYLRYPFEILMVWKGGLASHGAAIGILTALWMFARKAGKSWWWILDRIVIVIALSGFFIRTGNLMNSEIFGKASHVPWAFVFMRDNPVPRHPTQIYEALSYLVLFLFLYFAYFRKNLGQRAGLLFGIFMAVLWSIRFLVEFLKENQVDFENKLPLNMGQLLSIPFIIAGLVIIWLSLKNKLSKKGEIQSS
ncbi:MAG: prolipoprotein diacylglyceryl transferase [Bacteroidia bacterium]|nr:prolipoprotein diacylglyceryl transferase [Bacteroidia bacterium]